jgi:MerR family transcriptional regulator, mercuric resistance operon regulatory protein
MSTLTIAGLAEAGGVGVETVRYYQRRGLIRTPERPARAGHSSAIRRYGDADVRALRFIRSAQAAGFKLDEVAELVRLDAIDDRPRARELADRRVADLDAQIARLKSMRDALARLAIDCGSGPSGPCPILTAFDPS